MNLDTIADMARLVDENLQPEALPGLPEDLSAPEQGAAAEYKYVTCDFATFPKIRATWTTLESSPYRRHSTWREAITKG
jgi:hypothetical protein